MENLEDILWKDGSIEDNDISDNASEFAPAKIPYNCIMICCNSPCGCCGLPVSTFGC